MFNTLYLALFGNPPIPDINFAIDLHLEGATVGVFSTFDLYSIFRDIDGYAPAPYSHSFVPNWWWPDPRYPVGV